MFLRSPMAIYKMQKYCVKILKGIKFAEFNDKKFTNTAIRGDLDDLYDGGWLNSARLGIPFGFRTNEIETMIKIDRICLINKIFGTPVFE